MNRIVRGHFLLFFLSLVSLADDPAVTFSEYRQWKDFPDKRQVNALEYSTEDWQMFRGRWLWTTILARNVVEVEFESPALPAEDDNPYRLVAIAAVDVLTRRKLVVDIHADLRFTEEDLQVWDIVSKSPDDLCLMIPRRQATEPVTTGDLYTISLTDQQISVEQSDIKLGLRRLRGMRNGLSIIPPNVRLIDESEPDPFGGESRHFLDESYHGTASFPHWWENPECCIAAGSRPGRMIEFSTLNNHSFSICEREIAENGRLFWQVTEETFATLFQNPRAEMGWFEFPDLAVPPGNRFVFGACAFVTYGKEPYQTSEDLGWKLFCIDRGHIRTVWESNESTFSTELAASENRRYVAVQIRGYLQNRRHETKLFNLDTNEETTLPEGLFEAGNIFAVTNDGKLILWHSGLPF
ncbi:MAG: hypothetical protein KDA80_07100, partial [Planctomycetaceae bacterium]|nr:hypothetical protein [Planctomycetaceae bacterium]